VTNCDKTLETTLSDHPSCHSDCDKSWKYCDKTDFVTVSQGKWRFSRSIDLFLGGWGMGLRDLSSMEAVTVALFFGGNCDKTGFVTVILGFVTVVVTARTYI
jgi:hypothetical protein